MTLPIRHRQSQQSNNPVLTRYRQIVRSETRIGQRYVYAAQPVTWTYSVSGPLLRPGRWRMFSRNPEKTRPAYKPLTSRSGERTLIMVIEMAASVVPRVNEYCTVGALSGKGLP